MPYRDPERRRAAQREWARRKRAAAGEGQTSRPRLIDPEAGDGHLLDSAARVLAVLAEQVALVRSADVDVLARARVVGYIAGLGLRAVELVDHEARIAALEAARYAEQERSA